VPGKKRTPEKIHNGAAAHQAKITLRERVLEMVKPAHVFDAYCGPTGEMWKAVWSKAASYTGCDTDYRPFDPRHRFVADNRTVMRSIDLHKYNVFDLDAFGEPWEQLLILSARRMWKPSERGALLLTWRESHLRFTHAARNSLAVAAGRNTLSLKDKPPLVKMAVRRFLEVNRVTGLKSWGARGYSGAAGLGKRNAKEIFKGAPADQCYLAVVFEGAPAPT
jgi:hypothetical protein